MQIFISYKRENEPFARLVRENLLAWGYAVWMDIFDIPKGSYWPDEIDKGLRASDVVIGILSPQAVESRNVKNEWDWAIVYGRRLILLMHEQTYVPMNYVSVNYIPCVGSAQSNGISQLQTALQSKPSAPTAPPDPFRDYLQKLYDRINRYLGQKILATLRTDEGMPEPLRLTGESTPEAVEGLFSRQPQIDPLFAIGGIEDDPTPPDKFTDFQQAFDHFKGRVLLLGEPGAGKTITLLHTARDAVVRRLQDPAQPLPILGIIPTWDADKRQPIADWLIVSDPILRNPPMFGEGQGVGSIIQQGRALLLLDGLDELGGERPIDTKKPEGEKFDPRQRFLDALPANNEIMVTCRRQDYAEIGSKAKLNGAITLQPLSEAQIAAYLRGTAALWQAVQNDDGLREMAKTPLLLSFFAFAYQDHPEDAEKLTNLSDSPGDLRDAIFERYVRERYEHEARKLKIRNQEMPFTLEEIVENLGYAASQLLMVGKSDDWVDLMYLAKATVMPRLRGDLERIGRLALNLNYLSEGEVSGPTAAYYRFIHLLLRNYFAYLYAINHTNSKGLLRIDSLKIFTALKEARSYNSMIAALKDSDPEVRTYAAIGLGELRNPNSVELLIDFLNDPDTTVRSRAASALGKIGDRRAVEPIMRLLDRLNKTAHPTWRYSITDPVIEALGSLGNNRALPVLVDTFRSYQVREIQKGRLYTGTKLLDAIWSCSRGESEVIDIVSELLEPANCHPEEPELHSKAIRMSGELKVQRLVPPLIELLHNYTIHGRSGQPIIKHNSANCVSIVEALRAIGTPEALAAIEGIECPQDDE